ncbi:anthranilate synthase component I family protein [Candidatus Palauibacter sp.]|uniref:anthranilate synthase component I family protein n=1 Tax=Candidatus Palauibacter sp. TaxID=3101350 RepID=UPI003B026284
MIDTSVIPDFAEFIRLAEPGRIVPVAIEIPFDLDTPVTAFSKLRQGPFSFLLESVEGGERWARFSFLGSAPREAWRLDGSEIRHWTPGGGWGDPEPTDDPFGAFEAWITRYKPIEVPTLPRFWGGAVGFFGYDTVRWLERLPAAPPDDLGLPDACFMATEHVLIIDNLFSCAFAVAAVPISHDAEDLEALYRDACDRLADWVRGLEEPHGLERLGRDPAGAPEVSGNRSRDDYEAAVDRIREYIVAGDAYQVVVSQRAGAHFGGDPLELYRALRRSNPSPYLFFIELDGVRLIGSSPETLVRVEDGNVTVRPIAGTRPRGSSPEEDDGHARDLLADEKERAEHLMLVDLGRNDVGRVARPGSVEVARFMEIERYSHVMHLVSEVTGSLRSGVDAVDAFQACFPAGTLTGAPKVRAMEIIDELEPTRRGPYGGAAGYVGYGATSLDMAIVIRTLLSIGDRVYAQAGAGVVYDSVPAREWEETRHKARVLLEALADV